MKHIAESLTLGLAVLLASSIAPRAADWAVGSGGAVRDFGSIKDYRNAAVPVPAPTPAPQQANDWYVRGDLGYNFATGTSIDLSGGATANHDVGNFLDGGLGFGRYITPSLRGDITFDFRPKKSVTSVPLNFNASKTQAGGAVNTTDHLNYAVTQADDSSKADQTAMFNLYYDFHSSSRFTPYIGGGLGLDFARFKRKYSQSAVCTGGYNTDDNNNNAVLATYVAGSCPTPATQVTGFSGQHYTSSFGLAAAFTVGTAYQISNGIALDAGYRLLWEGASLGVSGNGINGSADIKISDRLDHEFRTGVRIDLN